MRFQTAFVWMKERGHRMQCAGFKGYWEWDADNETIVIVTAKGQRLDIRDTDNVALTIGFINSDEWSFYHGPDDPSQPTHEVKS